MTGQISELFVMFTSSPSLRFAKQNQLCCHLQFKGRLTTKGCFQGALPAAQDQWTRCGDRVRKLLRLPVQLTGFPQDMWSRSFTTASSCQCRLKKSTLLFARGNVPRMGMGRYMSTIKAVYESSSNGVSLLYP